MKPPVVLIVAAVLTNCSGTSSDLKLISICEEKVRARLNSPSTFNLISASVDAASLEEDDTMIYLRGAGCELTNLSTQECTSLDRYEKLAWDEGTATAEQKEVMFEEMSDIENRLWITLASRPASKRGSRTAKLEFDASNVYGAPTRKKTWCSFAPPINGEDVTARHIYWMSS